MSRIYVAGPITGLPEYNYPAFTRAAATLRNLGYHVESPHEPGHVEGWTWVDYMRRGLAQMLTCDTIALLPGWQCTCGDYEVFSGACSIRSAWTTAQMHAKIWRGVIS